MTTPQVVYITRHGQRLDWVDQNWRTTHDTLHKDDTPLSPIGKVQSIQLAAWLSANSNEIKHVFSSPYNRTIVTAHPTAELFNCKINVEHSITEWLATQPSETLTFPLFTEQYFLKWTNRYCTEYQSVSNPVSGYENIVDLHKRARKFVKKIESDYVDKGDIMVVCHAASHIALVRAFLKDVNMDVYPGTCCLTKLVRRDKMWVVEKLCEYSHLEEDIRVEEVLKPYRFPPTLQKELKDFLFE